MQNYLEVWSNSEWNYHKTKLSSKHNKKNLIPKISKTHVIKFIIEDSHRNNSQKSQQSLNNIHKLLPPINLRDVEEACD